MQFLLGIPFLNQLLPLSLCKFNTLHIMRRHTLANNVSVLRNKKKNKKNLR